MAGVAISKILILFGAGYTGTILLKNVKFSEVLDELKSLMKKLEENWDSSNGEADYLAAMAAQVHRLATEVKSIAPARQITVINGNSGQVGNITSLAIPAAALGLLGYGYMWWKGLPISDLVFVTKRNMELAVADLTKHLESVSATISAAKRHLTQRIQTLDGKLDDQKEISEHIKNEVTEARADFSQVGHDLDSLQKLVYALERRIDTLDYNQDLTNAGVAYLCKFVNGAKMPLPETVMEHSELPGKAHGLLTSSEAPSIQGLKDIIIDCGSYKNPKRFSTGIMPDSIANLDNLQSSLTRIV